MGNQTSTNRALILSHHNADHFKTIDSERDSQTEGTIHDGPTTITALPTPKISNEMIHINRMRHHIKQESIHNGVVGVFISLKHVQIALRFWNANVNNLDISDQLEIGCSIFFGMIASNNNIKKIFIGNRNSSKFEELGVKFLDMMGYVIRCLFKNNIDLYSNLALLGSLHSKQGITLRMFDDMLDATHESFSYYFMKQYTKEVKHAMDEVFTVVSRIMNHENVVSSINNLNIDYLECLDKCLVSLDGRTALLSYLKQCECNNIVLFYELLNKFKSAPNDMNRFVFARDIVRFNIDGINGKAKKVEISWKTAQNILNDMQRLDDLWFSKVPFHIDCTYFNTVEHEVNELVLQQYWNGFKQSILATY